MCVGVFFRQEETFATFYEREIVEICIRENFPTLG